jgi:hypothetical protein
MYSAARQIRACLLTLVVAEYVQEDHLTKCNASQYLPDQLASQKELCQLPHQ